MGLGGCSNGQLDCMRLVRLGRVLHPHPAPTECAAASSVLIDVMRGFYVDLRLESSFHGLDLHRPQ